MESLFSKYILPAPDIAWVPSLAAGAGVYLLEGRCHFAAHHSPTARTLLEAGALHVADLRFDRDPREASHPERPVRPLNTRQATERFSGAPTRN